jgi:guanine nucleotide-binding protein subunit alpha
LVITDNRYNARVDSGGDDSDDENENDASHLPHELEDLKMRLLPLQHIEALLMAKLVPPSEEEPTSLGGISGSGSSSSDTQVSGAGHEEGSNSWKNKNHGKRGGGPSWRSQEVFVRPGSRWKGVLAKTTYGHDRPISAGMVGLEIIDEPQHVLHECRRDIMALWGDPRVREILRRRKIRLEEFPGL